MTAPVTISSSSASAATAPAGPAPLGSQQFGNLLSLGLSNISLVPTTTAPEQSPAIANSDASAALLAQKNVKLEPALLLSPAELDHLSQEDLTSLLASISGDDGELNSNILISLTPGVPAKDILQNVKAKFEALGIDTSKFVAVNAPDHLSDTLTIDADSAQNFLLIATGLSPSEIEQMKSAIKDISDSLSPESSPEQKDSSEPPADDLSTQNSAAVMALVIFVAPVAKPAEAPPAQDIAFDLSALSAFTQPSGTDSAEPDWTKKLSDKLSTMTLTDDASPFDNDTSPFDDEMNSILSFKPAEGNEAGFQGSLSTTTKAKQESPAEKTVTGDVSAQALSALNHAAALPIATMHHLNGDGLLMANGNMTLPQNMSSLTNPVFTSASAASAHPSVQAVAVMIEKAASGSEKAKQELSVQLDPPELGRMQVQLSMEKDGIMKVHLLTEKQETLSLFQRDSHALKSALESAGIQVDHNSLTFDLASGDQSFNHLMGHSQDQQSTKYHSMAGSNGAMTDTGNADILDSKMDFVADHITGNVHYSFWA